MKNHRLFLTMTDEEFERFESAREQLGMNRSMYVRYLISGQKELRPPTIRYSKLINSVNSIERSLRMIALKEELSTEERLFIMEKLNEMKKMFNKSYGSGQIDSK